MSDQNNEIDKEDEAHLAEGMQMILLSSRQEMPIEDIIKLEQQTLSRVEHLFHDLEPQIVLKLNNEEDEMRDEFGLGSWGHGFVRGYHVINFYMEVGKEEGQDVNVIDFSPLTERDFADNYLRATLGTLMGKDIDPTKIDMYQAIHRLVETNTIVVEQLLPQYDVNYIITDSEEYANYAVNKDKGQLNGLQQVPYQKNWMIVLNYNDQDITHHEAQTKALMAKFLDHIEFLEPQYDALLHKFGAVNKYSI